MDTPVLARTTTPVTGSPFETAPGIAGAFPMGKVAFPGAGEADSGPPSKRRRPDYPAPVACRRLEGHHGQCVRTPGGAGIPARLPHETTYYVCTPGQRHGDNYEQWQSRTAGCRGDGTSSKGGHRKMQQGTGFLQSDVPCPQERRQITSDNQPKTTQLVCANASFHHDNPEGCEPTGPCVWT